MGVKSTKKEEIIKILKEGGVGVMPTDTIYGLLGSAFSKKAVNRIYVIRKRDPQKPFIILISSFGDLKKFEVNLDKRHEKVLQTVWFNSIEPVSAILPCRGKKFGYLHRGTNTLAFRLPRPKWLRRFLLRSGPLVAPSANISGYPPARTIKEAEKYFGSKVDFYIDGGRITGAPYIDGGRITGAPSVILAVKR